MNPPPLPQSRAQQTSAFKALGIGLLLAFGIVIVVGMLSMPAPDKRAKKEISDEAWKKVEERRGRIQAEERQKEQKRIAEEQQKDQERLNKRIELLRDQIKAYARAHPESEKYWDMMNEGKIAIGWTEELVRTSWGPPERINNTLTARRNHSQWVYGIGTYVYFEDGVCTSIQTSK